MAAVGHDDTVVGEQFADASSRSARIQAAVGREAVAPVVGAQGADIHALAPPGGRSPCAAEAFEHEPRDLGGVAAHVPVHLRMGGGGGDIDLEHLRPRREQLAETGEERVERGAEDDGDIGLAHERHRRVRAEAAGHAEVVPVFGEDSPAERARRGDRTGLRSQLAEHRTRVREPRAASGEQERSLCAGEPLSDAIQCGFGDRAGGDGGSGRRGQGQIGDRTDLTRRHIVRDGDHRGLALRPRMLERGERGRGSVPDAHGVRPHADRGGEGDLVDVPRSRPGGGRVADHQQQRDARLRRLGERCEGVREARAIGRGRRRQPSADAVVGIGRHDPAGLVADGDEGGVGAAFDRVEEVRVAGAHHPEHPIEATGEGDRDMR
ncbi:hypothetical protein O159_17260 [Leifsonia xyli subsp. cynodontis DSM 46306]|uniref:Uncharacterized protein n=1 Tax=Leifsonia xyli subsp. cynodontis DSM 46306 TaxID=1389489 RepID=U3PDX6_LEIXC|nr:hypothetical protein O159_17260 [Leifsonia xyli subsp. cynodontis DSM 46306]